MLSINNLYKNYGKLQVLKGVNLHVQKGEIKALIGMNGAGKSTLLENVCGVKPFSSGDIFINGLNVLDKKNKNTIKHIVGYMPQKFGLYSDLTVEENLRLLCAIYRLPNEKETVKKILSLCFLEDKNKVIAKNLSGGYQQLLSLAAALINDPKILILDEPTSAMDPLFRNQFWDILKTYKQKGTTIFVITHHMEELSYCDSFACLYNGEIVHDSKIDRHMNGKVLNIKEILNIYSQNADE